MESILGEVTFEKGIELVAVEAVFHEREDFLCGCCGLFDFGMSLSSIQVEGSIAVAAALGHFLNVEGGELGFCGRIVGLKSK